MGGWEWGGSITSWTMDTSQQHSKLPWNHLLFQEQHCHKNVMYSLFLCVFLSCMQIGPKLLLNMGFFLDCLPYLSCIHVYVNIASYPDRVGGEKRPGVDCFHMRNHSQKTWESIYVWTIRICPIYFSIIKSCSCLRLKLQRIICMYMKVKMLSCSY